MKKNWKIFVIACLLSWSPAALAQTNKGTAAKAPSSAATGKNKNPTESKKPAAEEFAKPKTAGESKYKIVDGRKVMIDGQGVQSLATPNPSQDKLPDPKTKTPKK